MPVEVDSQLAAGRKALEAGRWAQAREAFRAALEAGESGEALAGHGEALWWLGENHTAMRYRERAYAAFRRQGEPAATVDVALWLCKSTRRSARRPGAPVLQDISRPPTR